MSETLRLFIGVPIPEPQKTSLARIRDRLEEEASRSRVRWVGDDSFHITLKFLGKVPAERLTELMDALDSLAGRGPAFDVGLGKLGAFPSPGRPKTIWRGVEDPDGRLARLAEGTDKAFKASGFASEDRRFRPHVTLGRVKDPRGTEWPALLEAEAPAPVRLRIDRIVLYESRTLPTGAVYKELHTVVLDRPAPAP